MPRTPSVLRRWIGLAAVAAFAPPAAAADRPNILWLTAEDICPHLGCCGDTYAVTPALDRFATQAARYTQAYGIIGVCYPMGSACYLLTNPAATLSGASIVYM